MKAVFLLDEDNYNIIYSEECIKKISEKVEILGRYDSIDEACDLSDVDFVFSGWGAVPMDKKALQAMPKLKVVFYGAGSIKKVQTEEMWNKPVRITSASTANAIPVAQYTTSLIQLLLKDFFTLTRKVKENRQNKMDVYRLTDGFYKRKIGIISYSKIGKEVIKNLQYLSENEIYVYDPFYDENFFKERNLIKSSLEEIFEKCDVVSLHSPLLKETEGMVNYQHFSKMKKNAAFINTARGKIINTDDLIKALNERTDLTAILDVSDPEPLEKNSALYDMDNVILSPHIAGSLGNETLLMGELMYEELARYIESGDLKYEISREAFLRMA